MTGGETHYINELSWIPFRAISQEEKLFWGIGDVLHSSKIKVGSCQNHPTRPETGKIEKPIKTERFPKKSSLEGNEGNMGEIVGKTWQAGKTIISTSEVEYHSVRFPKRRNYSRGIGDVLHSSKIKVGSCQNHPTRPETGEIEKPIKTERFPKKSSLERNEGNMGEIIGHIQS